ncbi:hypothetical protein TCAL_17054 [Tigriopus californicus]|uniref:G-protein coupled receptors family 2 profile 1 domain-containing protein n=1 Tax=Tigriopus californicus TaxID=6832 RepID=A0A553PQ26_TIGCA|nr:hypothetical protein TCAL_17054 [Tigriopus californicus]
MTLITTHPSNGGVSDDGLLRPPRDLPEDKRVRNWWYKPSSLRMANSSSNSRLSCSSEETLEVADNVSSLKVEFGRRDVSDDNPVVSAGTFIFIQMEEVFVFVKLGNWDSSAGINGLESLYPSLSQLEPSAPKLPGFFIQTNWLSVFPVKPLWNLFNTLAINQREFLALGEDPRVLMATSSSIIMDSTVISDLKPTLYSGNFVEEGLFSKTMYANRPGWDFTDVNDCRAYHAANHSFPGHCNSTWDGFLCWPLTRPGTEASQPCPANVKGILKESKKIINK